MYTRSYHPNIPEDMSFPERYDGTSLLAKEEPTVPEGSGGEEDMPPKLTITKGIVEEMRSEAEPTAAKKCEGGSVFDKLRLPDLSRIPFLGALARKEGFLGGFFKNFGYEDILLIGLALLLFFSKSGDKECALIILALLFIN